MTTLNTYTPLEEEAGADEYLASHIDPEGDYLYRLYRATNIHTIHGRMASGHLQGRLLKMLVHMIRPKNILEVGTFSGYSAICMAEGLEEGGKLYTFEINDEMEDFTRPWIEGSPVADKIDFRIGDAAEEAPKLGILFDMAFVDGDKRTYAEMYEKLLPIIRPGDIFLLITRFGTGMLLTQHTIMTIKLLVSDDSMTLLQRTNGLRKLSFLYVMDLH